MHALDVDGVSFRRRTEQMATTLPDGCEMTLLVSDDDLRFCVNECSQERRNNKRTFGEDEHHNDDWSEGSECETEESNNLEPRHFGLESRREPTYNRLRSGSDG